MARAMLRDLRALAQCAEAGLSQTGAAAVCGMTRGRVRYLARFHLRPRGVRFACSPEVFRSVQGSAQFRRYEREIEALAA